MTPSAGPALEERAFQRWVAARFAHIPVGRLPLGDDTAAIPLGGRRVALLTTDALTLGTHFLDRSPPKGIGAAAAAASLSDVAAKGGRPVAFLLDLLLPPGTPARWARSVLEGAEGMLARFGAHVVGGDTKPARTRAVVGSLLGVGRADRLAPRHAARPGDLLVTTGAVGKGGFAARALRPGHVPSTRELASLLDVRPRVLEGPRLAPHVHAMADTSDGLAEAAHLVAQAARCRLVLEADRLPLYPPLARLGGSLEAKLATGFFGGDYELFAALAPERLRRARDALAPVGCPLTVVGHVERGRGAWLTTSRGVRPLPHSGWAPFGPPSR